MDPKAIDNRYYNIFKAARVSIWEEDFSEIICEIERLRAQKIRDFRNYFNLHSELVQKFIRMVKIIDVNHITLNIFEAESKEELFGSLEKVFLPASMEVFKEELIAIADGKTYFESEAVVRTLKGKELNILLSMPIPSEKSKFKSLPISLVDITKRKKLEDVITRSEARLAEAQRIAKVGSWEWDIINKKAYHSDELLRILGRTEDEFDGTFDTFLSFVHPDDRNIVQQVINEAFSGEGKGTFSIEYRLIRPDGSVCIVHDEGKIFFDDSGAPIRMVGSKQDITANKRIEEELLKAVKLEALGVLAGGIAHDFNNILTAILGNISLAKIELNPNDQIFKILNESEKASLRAKSLTDQLLTFSKGGAPVMEIVSLRELIPDWCHFARMGDNVRADICIPDNLWNVEIDEGQMQQVFHNLVINACQAMPQGGVINVQAENMTVKKTQRLPLETGRYVKISILDHGIGISEKHLTKIFDPFFTTKQSGSGLGLSTTYSIMKRHLGHIQVESELGIGTTFHIYLPASHNKVAVVSNLDKGLHRGEGRILLMDDEEIIRDFAATALKHFGYEVELASDGTEAIRLYKRSIELGQLFSAAILDLTIPGGMGGKEAIKEILKIDPDAKVIVSSGYSKDPIMADYKNHGFKGILTKPYKSSDLGEIIKRVIEKSDE